MADTVGNGGEPRMQDDGARYLRSLQTHHGVPRWMRDDYAYCARCGGGLRFGPVPDEERERLQCDSCGFIAYVNPRMVVTTLPITEQGRVVLLRRGIEPGYGLWAQPGGFLEVDETALQGAVRETVEETGLVVEPTRIVGIYSRPQAAVVVAAWEARIVGGERRTGLEAIEIEDFGPAEIPWPTIAFNTSTWALRDWVRGVAPEVDLKVAVERERR
jgi:ADP-ribose pyrophosphatase YjhB (NUDIX family)